MPEGGGLQIYPSILVGKDNISKFCKFYFGRKLKALKPISKVWNWEVFGNVGRRKKRPWEISGGDEIELSRPLSVSELEERGRKRGLQQMDIARRYIMETKIMRGVLERRGQKHKSFPQDDQCS